MRFLTWLPLAVVLISVAQPARAYVAGQDASGNTVGGTIVYSETAAGVAQQVGPGTPLPVIGTAVTGMPTVSSVTLVSASSPSTLIPSGAKSYWSITNQNATGDLACTWDGSTPSATNFNFQVWAGTPYNEMPPGFVHTSTIQCIGEAVTVAEKAEYY